MNHCPRCNNRQIVGGWLGSSSAPAIFRPTGLRSFSVTQDAGARFAAAEASACLDCGLIWGGLPSEKLREFVRKHCARGEAVQLDQCPNCQGNRVTAGKLIVEHRPAMLPSVFVPSGRQAFSFTLGGPRFTSETMACLDCGWVWASTSPEKLRQYIQENCDRTPANAAAFDDATPSSGWKEMWIGGIVLALLPISYGLYCLYTGHALFPRRRAPMLDLRGWEAVVLAIAYIAAGAFLHFRYFWGRHPRLRSRSPRLRQGALLVFLGAVGYTAFRHFF